MRSVPQNVIKHKVGLLNLAAELGNVSRACKVTGFSRDTFYRYQTAVETGGVDALIDANRRKPNLRNRVKLSLRSLPAGTATIAPIKRSDNSAVPNPFTRQKSRQAGIFFVLITN